MWTFERSREFGVKEPKGAAFRRPARSRLPPLAVYPLLAALGVLLPALLLPPSAAGLPPAGGLYDVQEISPQVFVWVPEDILDQLSDPRFNRATTAGFISTPEGVVVVNTTNSPFHAREVLYEIRRRTDLPVRYVINTGSDGDCVLGNEVFQDLRATIISTRAAQEEIRLYRQELARRIREDFRLEARMRGIHVTVPGETFDRDLSLKLGGREIKLINFGGGQSPGNAVVYLPDAKVVFLGGLFSNGFFPSMNGGDVRRWIDILRQVEGWDVTVCVPARGLPGGKKELGEFRGFLEWLVAEIEPRVRQGMSLIDIKREVNPLEKYNWRIRDLAPRAVESVYRQLLEHSSAKP